MIEEILKYHNQSKILEYNANERKALLDKVIDYTESFNNNLNSLPAFQIVESVDCLNDFYISDNPVPIDTILFAIKEYIDKPGLNPASGGHLAYIPGSTLFGSILGDYLSATTNKYSGVYFASPGAVFLENMLIKWLCEIVGYPQDSAGNLTSGGSIANLIGIVSAREASGIRAKNIEKSVIYLTTLVHHSVKKSLKVAGLGEAIIRYIPMDEKYRMVPELLEKKIIEDKNQGLIPLIVVSSAGTTDCGSIDPLNAISDICNVNKIWHHIDGAYGGFFVLSDIVKSALKGIEKSDSLVMDPHKGLFNPYGIGSIIVKDKQAIFNAHHLDANYLQDADKNVDIISPNDLSPEMTKHFRALRMWLPLKLAGLEAFKSALNEKILLARYFYEKINSVNRFEVGPYPDLSIVTYRYIPKKGDPNIFNQKLIKKIQADGRVFISSTTLNNSFILRMAILSYRTHIDIIDNAINILQQKAIELENE